MKATILSICILFTITAHSQSTLNNYKYVLVPAKFDFLKEEDQYGLNSSTKLQLELKGFVALMSNEKLPDEVAGNKCNALTAEVIQKKGFLVTNLTVQLKDCQGNILFKSKEGKSREKEFRPAYNLALQDAFTSLNDVAYKYDGTVAAPVQQVAAAAPTQPAMPVATTPAPAVIADINGTLYAQSIPNGFQLVDTTPKKY